MAKIPTRKAEGVFKSIPWWDQGDHIVMSLVLTTGIEIVCAFSKLSKDTGEALLPIAYDRITQKLIESYATGGK